MACSMPSGRADTIPEIILLRVMCLLLRWKPVGLKTQGPTLIPGMKCWAYIPCNLLPHLKWLTDPTYGDNNHVYYVDLKPRIADVKIFTADSTHINGWGTVLIGGMRLGGGPLTINNFGGGTHKQNLQIRLFCSGHHRPGESRSSLGVYECRPWVYLLISRSRQGRH